MGAPEVSVFVASRGDSEAAALAAAEKLLPALRQWQQDGWIRSYDSPAWYVPTPATQRARLSALPNAAELDRNLRTALRGLRFRADAFVPFAQEVAAARTQPALTRAAYAATPLGAKLNALFVHLDDSWLVLTPLGGVNEIGRLTSAPVPGCRWRCAAFPRSPPSVSWPCRLRRCCTPLAARWPWALCCPCWCAPCGRRGRSASCRPIDPVRACPLTCS